MRAVYHRPPVPQPVAVLAVASLEELEMMQKQKEEELRKERLISDTARLETRIKLFFEKVAPDETLKGKYNTHQSLRVSFPKCNSISDC